MAKVKKVVCPHCNTKVQFKRNDRGKWVGTIVGGGAGYGLAAGLTTTIYTLLPPTLIAAPVFGLIIGGLLGKKTGEIIDNNVKCPKCGKRFSL